MNRALQTTAGIGLAGFLMVSWGCGVVRFSLVPTLDPSRPIGLDEAVIVTQPQKRDVREVRTRDGLRLQVIPIVARRVEDLSWDQLSFSVSLVGREPIDCDCVALGRAAIDTRLDDPVGQYAVPRSTVEAFRAKDWLWNVERPDAARLSLEDLGEGSRSWAGLSDSVFIMGIDSVETTVALGGALVDSLLSGQVWWARWSLGAHRPAPRADRAVRLGSLRAGGIRRVHIAGQWTSLEADEAWFIRPWNQGFVSVAMATVDEVVAELESSSGGWTGLQRWQQRFLNQLRNEGEARIVLACRRPGGNKVPLRPGQAALLIVGPQGPNGHEFSKTVYYPMDLDRRNGLFGALTGIGLVLAFLVYSTS